MIIGGAGLVPNENQQMNRSQSEKWMSNGEAGLALFFSVSAFLCMVAAAKALDAAFAFHATLGVAASVSAAFAIFNRYYEKGSFPPQEINGRPNYNLGPIKYLLRFGIAVTDRGFRIYVPLSR